jgi:hypothetical protein
LEALVPILVRPVREQLEHDRIIRLLEAKWRRKFKVDANPGDERNVGVKVPAGTLYPDLILTEEGGRKPKALVEVETNESVNHLEAMAQWANLAKSRTSLFLFVPVGAVEAARRLANESSVKLAELWTYLVLGDQVRFTSVFREDGAEPADLIEKVEVFTTERPAPAPRPVPIDPVPQVEPPAAEPERPRKLAVKAGSRPVDGVAAKAAPKVAVKGPGRATAPPAPPEPEPAAKPAMPVKGAAKTEPKAESAKAQVAKPIGAVKGTPAVKAVAPPKAATVPAKATPKAVADKAPVRPPEKLVGKNAASRPEPKKVAVKSTPPSKATGAKVAPAKVAPAKVAPAKSAAKPVPIKAVGTAKKPTVAKPAPRPAAHKAVPARPTARVVAPAKKAAAAAKAPASKRK